MEQDPQSWFQRTFSTGDIIAICAGALGMVTAFYNLKGNAESNTHRISSNQAEIINVEKRDIKRAEELKEYIQQSENRLRGEINDSDSRNEERFKDLNSKIDRILERQR